jgi:hypothetical protein
MASHATTSNAAHARQARQERLLPTGIGSKGVRGVTAGCTRVIV